MKPQHLLAIAAVGSLCTAAVAAGPFDAFKGKVKPGLYEYKMEMDMGNMPGMPPGMGKQSHTMQHCLTPEDLDKGQMNKGRDGKMPQDCEVKNFKMSGNNASYTMECKGQHPMVMDANIVLQSDGFKMDNKMTMTQGGKPMTVTQKMESHYIGECKK